MDAGSSVKELIVQKRDGGELTGEQIVGLIESYLDGKVDEAQMAALLMAGLLQGFSTAEAIAFTDAFVASGETVDLSDLKGPTVDKHSTGGVGDSTSLVVGPLLAACEVQVAKLSGRGLGHTGGTLDKLESIPGMQVDLTPAELRDQVERIGVAIVSATGDLVPADRQLYALRDVTGTVASPALIASSVMSKKIAGGAQHVLLDVKVGDGAFLSDPQEASDLADLCVSIGEQRQRRTAALVTDMSQPLGDAVGNALEVAEAISVLQGQREGRFAQLCVDLAAAALHLTGIPLSEATQRVEDRLASGAALERFSLMVDAQGGDPTVTQDPWAVLPKAPVVDEWAPGSGHVIAVGCRRFGELSGRLGAGRTRQGEDIDPAVGLEVLVRVGDVLEEGQPAVRIHARTQDDADRVKQELADLVVLGDEAVEPPPLIHDRIGLA